MSTGLGENRKYIITGILIVLVAIGFGRFSYGVILPFMKEGLSISYKSAGILGTFTSLGYLVTVMFAGYLTARWGGKNTILLGLFFLIIGFFNLSITVAFWHSSIFMFMLGVGAAFIFTPLIAILIGWFPNKRGLVIGYVNSSAGIGLLFVGFLVPFLTDLYPDTSWRITWKIFCIISIFVLLITIMIIKNPPQKKTIERSTTPIKRIYTSRRVVRVGLIYGIVGTTLIVQSIFIMSFMLEAGLDKRFAGQLISLNGILSIFSSPIWGGISDRFGRRNSLAIAMGLNLLSILFPVLLPNMIGFTVNLVIQGAVAIGILTLIQALSTEQVASEDAPIAFSYVTFYFAVGQFVGPTLAGWIIDYSGFKSAYLLSAMFISVGFYLTLKLSTDTPLGQKV